MNKKQYIKKRFSGKCPENVDLIGNAYEDGQKDILVKVANLYRISNQVSNMSHTNISTGVMFDLQNALADIKNGLGL
jgi:hypothetical protein